MYFLQNKSAASRETTSNNTTGSDRQCPAQKLYHPMVLYDALGGQTVHKDLPDGASADHEIKCNFSDHWGKVSDGCRVPETPGDI